ncbi:hypothetical protein D3C87_2008550 [compost metagenome]
MRQRHVCGVYLAQRAYGVAVDHAVFLPATHAHHLVAHGVLGVLAFGHFAHGATDHDFAQAL